MRPLLFISAVFCPTAASYIRYDQGVSQWTAEDPLVTIINTSNKYRAYSIETAAEAPSSAFAGCESCIKVPASKTIRFHPGRGFNGAMTANNHRGSRHEINFLADPTKCWYDVDMELGMSDETLGPSDNQNIASGAKSLLGEPHTLAKANAAWYDTTTSKQRSLLASGCLQGTVGGDLTAITMHSQADEEFVDWLQGYAQFNAYIAPGSVRGQSTGYSDAMADKKTHLVNTVKMTITIY